MKCPHCEQESAKESWPFCSWCRLFLVPLEELILSKGAPITAWRTDRMIVEALLN